MAGGTEVRAISHQVPDGESRQRAGVRAVRDWFDREGWRKDTITGPRVMPSFPGPKAEPS
jgi:hypothetical protein